MLKDNSETITELVNRQIYGIGEPEPFDYYLLKFEDHERVLYAPRNKYDICTIFPTAKQQGLVNENDSDIIMVYVLCEEERRDYRNVAIQVQ